MNPVRLLSTLASPAGPRARLSVLFFHRVVERADPLAPWEPTAGVFDSLLGWLQSHLTLLPLDEAVARLRQGSLPAAAAAITFDDGYRDNFEVAAPLLRRRGVPATFFVATRFLDGGVMWNDIVAESIRGAAAGTTLPGVAQDQAPRVLDDGWDSRRAAVQSLLQAIKYQPPSQRDDSVAALAAACGVQPPRDLMMTSEQVRSLAAMGFGIGAHTDTHPILSRLNDAAAQRDIERSRDRLGELLGRPVGLFAYPNGRHGDDFDDRHARMVEALGFSAAFSTERGVAVRSTDRFALPRFTPWSRRRWRFHGQLLANMAHAARGDRPKADASPRRQPQGVD